MHVIDKPSTMKGPLAWFTGDVYVDPIAEAQGSAVTIGAGHFTRGAPTAGHRHTVGQTLYVTEGEGRVQSRGGPVITIRAGDVMRSPAARSTGTAPRPSGS